MFKNIIKVLLSNILLAIIGLLNSLIFPILLSIENYAYYQQYILYISYINICHLGIASGMFLNYAGKDYKMINKSQYKSEIYLIYLVLAAFSGFGLILFFTTKSIMILYIVLTIFPQCIIASFQALYQSWERFTSYSIINALPKLIYTIVTIVVVVALQNVSGHFVIVTYLLIIWCFSLYYEIEFAVFTKNSKSSKMFSAQNRKTTLTGLLITLGNYANLLFQSIDKQYVNMFYSTESFAVYSFAMSLQNIMILFITAISNPFYPRLAKGDVSKQYMLQIKELLFMFGAYSGCAYFAVSFFVKHFVSKYTDSLEVVAIFFTVFPAMAVINVLYINLYKIKHMFRKYILTLIGMLCIAVIFNGVAVLMRGNYIGISIATMVLYYVWLIYSQRDFTELNIEFKDYLFLAGFFIIYNLAKLIKSDIIGFFAYAIVISAWDNIIYGATVRITLRNGYNKIIKKYNIETQ